MFKMVFTVHDKSQQNPALGLYRARQHRAIF